LTCNTENIPGMKVSAIKLPVLHVKQQAQDKHNPAWHDLPPSPGYPRSSNVQG